MKKISLLTLILTTGIMAMAQDRPQDGGKDFKAIRTPLSNTVRFGLAGGINMAKMNINPDNDSVDVNGRTTFHFGGFVNIPLSGNVSFQPGIMYSGQGGTIADNRSAATNEGDYDLSMHYINVPLMLNFRMASGIYLELGATPGFLVGARAKDISIGTTTIPDIDVKDNYDGFELAANAGIGYMTRIGLGFGARYGFGLTNILEEEQSKGGNEQKHRVLQIGLTYQFGAHK